MRLIPTLTTALLACLSVAPAAAQDCRPAPAEPVDWHHAVGALHNHSGYSDGAPGTTPRDYYRAGRAQGLDFMGGAEHSDNSAIPLTVDDGCLSPGFPDCVAYGEDGADRLNSLRKWEATAEQAAAASANGYAAFRGFEWTSDRFGHVNVFFSQHNLNAKTGPGYALSMELFWNWLATDAAIGGGADGLAVFNHPGREDAAHVLLKNLGQGDMAYVFNDFEYRVAVADRVVGLEVFGKGSHYDESCVADGLCTAGPNSYLAYALAKGWHLGPISGEDHHDVNWALPGLPKTVALLPTGDTTSEQVRDAMLQRRFYAVAQHYNDVRLEFGVAESAEGPITFPMGSRVQSGSAAVGLVVTLGATPGVSNPTVELVGAAGITTLTMDGERGSLQVSVPPTGEDFYFVRVSADGKPLAYTAPVWVSAGDGPSCVMPF